MALARGLRNISEGYPYRFCIAHVNHQLRGMASEKDAEFVHQVGKEAGWPVFAVKKPIPSTSGNLEEMARERRYEALIKIARRFQSQLILTAHTQDDQVETIFMNILRGTGPDGLGGMAPLRNWPQSNVRIGRPLLDVSKKDVLRYLKEKGFAWRKDHTNSNPKFLRNWLRNQIVPKLEKRVPGFQRRVAHLAHLMRGEQAYWSEVLREVEVKVLRRRKDGRLLDFERLLSYSPAVQRRVLRHVLGGDLMSFDSIENLRRWMDAPPTGGRFWQMRKGWIAERLSKSTGSPSAHLFWLRHTRTERTNYPEKRRKIKSNEKI